MSDNDSTAQKSVLFFALLILIAVGAIAFFLLYSSKDAGKAKVKTQPHEKTPQKELNETPQTMDFDCYQCEDSGWTPCGDCEGTGICPKCDGTGKIMDELYVNTKYGSRNADGSKKARNNDSGGYMKRSAKLCPRKCQTCKGKGWFVCRECKNPKRKPVPKPLPKQRDPDSE